MQAEDEELSPVQRVVRAITQLSDETYRSLVERLTPPNVYLTDEEVEAALREAGLSPEASDMLTGFLVSYADARVDGVTGPNVLRRMATSVSEELKLDGDLALRRVQELGAAPALELLVLAKQNRERRVNIVVGLSIETDLRPIFHDAYGDAPAAEIVSHALRFAATSDLANESRPQQVYEFVLDQNDLVKLVGEAQAALTAQRKIQVRAEASGSRASFDFRAGEAIQW